MSSYVMFYVTVLTCASVWILHFCSLQIHGYIGISASRVSCGRKVETILAFIYVKYLFHIYTCLRYIVLKYLVIELLIETATLYNLPSMINIFI